MKKIVKLFILILIGVLGGVGGSMYLGSERDHEEETY